MASNNNIVLELRGLLSPNEKIENLVICLPIAVTGCGSLITTSDVFATWALGPIDIELTMIIPIIYIVRDSKIGIFAERK
jgi:hypothetical protein